MSWFDIALLGIMTLFPSDLEMELVQVEMGVAVTSPVPNTIKGDKRRNASMHRKLV